MPMPGPILEPGPGLTKEHLQGLYELHEHVERRERRVMKRKLKRYFDDPLAFAHDCIVWPEGSGLTSYQEEVLSAVPEKHRVQVRGPHGLGKDLSVETPIATPTGWTTMGALEVGSVIFDEAGRPTTVTYAEDPQWRDAFLVKFSDGASIVAGAGHLWSAVDVYYRPKSVTDWREHWEATREVETAQIAASLKSPGGQLRWRVPTSRPFDLPEAELPLDPYLLGYWLGDGTTLDGTITCCVRDMAHLVQRTEAAGFSCRVRQNRDRTPTLMVKGLRAALSRAGVLGDKHIPMPYLRASEAQRRELVRGLWDSDGYRQAGGCDEVTLTHKALAMNVGDLLRSLGLSVRVHESEARLDGRYVSQRWRIAARFDFRPYHLPRYNWEPRGAQASRHTQRTITEVVPVGQLRTRCIAVDAPSHLFLAGEDLVPTHNTMVETVLVLWFAITRDAAEVDWKAITTAGSWRQLEKFLWVEVHKWARKLDWEHLGRERFRRDELLSVNLKLAFGQASSAAATDPGLIEGAHADQILYIFDEAKSIPPGIWDAAEGALSTDHAYALACSTPGERAGRFYEIDQQRPGLEDWYTRSVTTDEVISTGRMSRAWAEQRRLQWGEQSTVYRNRVLGEFADSDPDSVIPYSWVEAAVNRWHEHCGEGMGDERLIGLLKANAFGVDVARTGEDETCIAVRAGLVVSELRRTVHEDTMKTVDRCVAAKLSRGAEESFFTVDTDGLGAGVTDRLRQLEYNTNAFHAGAKTDMRDISGELGFVNVRSAAWWNLRALLDPSNDAKLALPPDDKLLGDLTAPKWRVVEGNRIMVEKKDDIRKRIGRSTDTGDAVVQACWVQPAHHPPRMHYRGVPSARARQLAARRPERVS